MSVWLNEYDVEEALRLFDDVETPVLFAAATQLAELVRWTNRNSDGWPYWAKPARAAGKLQQLLHDGAHTYRRGITVDAELADLKKALAPIKAFRTRQAADFTLVELTDTSSSASRQHYIDTGRYLQLGEAFTS